MAGIKKNTVRHQWYGGIRTLEADRDRDLRLLRFWLGRGYCPGSVRHRHRRGNSRLEVATKNHLASRRLQHAGHNHVNGLADHLPCIINHDHRAVIQIRNALVVLFAFLQDEYLEDFAGQHDRLQGIRQLVDVEDVNAPELGDLVQIEIVRDDLALQSAGELDQLQIDLANLGKVNVGDGHRHAGHFLNLLKNVETA